MVSAILSGAFVVNYYLETYYINTKTNALKEVEDKLEEIDIFDSDDVYELNSICEKNGVTLIMQDSAYRFTYGFGPVEAMNDRLEDFRNESSSDYIKQKTIEKDDNYKIIKSTDLRHDNAMHLEMYGTTDNGNIYMLRIAVSNINESISIVNKFYIIMLAVIIIVLFVAITIITRRFTKPVLELAEISRKMAKLDFDVKYNVKSQDEIGILGTSINEMSSELERTISELKSANAQLQRDIDKKNEIEAMRNDFISNVSHELKTPIALIQGYAEGLRDGISEDPEDREYYCNVIVDEAAKMNRMVRNLLTLNQIEYGDEKIVMERFDITALISGVINSWKMQAQQEGIEIVLEQDNPVYVWGDEFQVEEIISNYISNAFNHIDINKLIKVQIIQKDDIVRVSVFNTGENIPKDDIEHIWDKFYKVDKARTREYGGNGIGLSIVKAIVNRMGRECGVINKEDGVEFWFEIDGGYNDLNMTDDERK